MKKFLMTFIALVAMATVASAQTVYVSTGDGAVAYHKSKSCSYLTNSKQIKSVTTAEAKKMGRHECQRCFGTAVSTKKVTPKKTTTVTKSTPTTKKVEKKATTTAKKTTPARDEKGRFVKKTDEKTTTATKKATPARDEKGRFIKTTDQKSKKTTDKKTEKKTKKAA